MIELIGALLSGMLLGASFPPSPFGILSLAAYVPLIISLIRYGKSWSRWKTIAVLYITFFIYHLSSNWWISSWQEQTDPYLFASGIVLDLFHPFFLMLPWVVLASIRKRLGVRWMMMTIPLAMAGFEWLHGQTDASYPWLTSGYMLVYSPLGQVAELVGVYGLTFLIGVVNVLVAQVVQAQSAGVTQSVAPRSRRNAMITVIAFVAVWAGLGAWLQAQASNSYNAEKSSTNSNRDLRVSLIQPNENPWDKWSAPESQLQHHMSVVDTARKQLRISPDVCVWSETAIPFMILQPEHAADRAMLQNWIDTSGIALLTGFADLSVYAIGTAPPSARRSRIDSNVYYDVFNAAMLMSPHSQNIPIHRKSMLTPFAERFPFADQLTFAMTWVQWGVGISSWGKGQTRVPIPVVKNRDTLAKIGVIICIESIYPEMVRDVVANGADVLCVITNDAWYNGTTGPGQHFDIARMRAIEQRRVVLRCANSGVTGAIAPDGSTLAQIPVMQQGACNLTVRTSSLRTVYGRIGDVIPPLGLLLSLILFFTARFPALIRKMPFYPHS